MRKTHNVLAVLFVVSTLCVTCVGLVDTEDVLHTFTGGNDGAAPSAGLISDSSGNFYGTASQGGIQNCTDFGGTQVGCGIVFKLSLVNGQWQFTVLYAFTGGTDGADPSTGLTFDPAGNLYGTTSLGGDLECSVAGATGCGTVFELTPNGGTWTETVLHSFTNIENGDGALPTGGVSFDEAGNLYGTTAFGGNVNTGAGTVFRLSHSSKGWKETGIYDLDETVDGLDPQCATLGPNGSIFVDTYEGGAGGWGTVFALQLTSHGLKKGLLHSFSSYPDGSAPTGCLVLDSKGNVYGTTQQSPAVFELSPGSEGQWAEAILYSFNAPGDGNFPSAGVRFDKAGNLYGTCEGGGNYDAGTVFRLSPPQQPASEWNESILYDFTGKSDGGIPASPLISDKVGNLYGTTLEGGLTNCDGGCGVVFQLVP